MTWQFFPIKSFCFANYASHYPLQKITFQQNFFRDCELKDFILLNSVHFFENLVGPGPSAYSKVPNLESQIILTVVPNDIIKCSYCHWHSWGQFYIDFYTLGQIYFPALVAQRQSAGFMKSISLGWGPLQWCTPQREESYYKVSQTNKYAKFKLKIKI